MKSSNFTIWIPVVGMFFVGQYARQHSYKNLFPIGLIHAIYHGVIAYIIVDIVIDLLIKNNVL